MSNLASYNGIIIGALGLQGGRWLNTIINNKYTNLISIIDIEKNSNELIILSNKIGCEYSTNSRQEIKRSDVDFVVIATPNDSHYDLTCQAIKFKKHVLTEKPLVTEIDQMDFLINYAYSNNTVLTSVFNFRYRSPILIAKKILNEKTIGDIINLNADLGHSQFFHAQDKARIKNYIDPKKQGGSVIFDLGIHVTDLAIYIMGDFISAFGICNKHIKKNVRMVENAWFINDRGDIFSLNTSWVETREYMSMRLNISGQKGRIEVDLFKNELEVSVKHSKNNHTKLLEAIDSSDLIDKIKYEKNDELYHYYFSFSYPDNCWSYQLEEFIDKIRNYRPDHIYGIETYKSVSMLNSMFISSNSEGCRTPIKIFSLTSSTTKDS